MTWVFDNSPYTGGGRLVHLALADKANDDHDYELWMHQSKVAEMARLSVNQVGRILKQMVTDGYLDLVEQGGGRGKASRYRLVLKTPQYGGVSDSETPPSGTGNPTISDAETPPSVESRLLPTEELNQGRTEGASLIPSIDPMIGWDQFWDTYPMRNGKRLFKAQSQVIWKRLSLDDKRAAMRGAINYRAAVDAEDQIAKDPHRWLRDKLWTDWQDPPEGGTSVRRDPRGPRGGDPMRRGGSGLRGLMEKSLDQDAEQQRMALSR